MKLDGVKRTVTLLPRTSLPVMPGINCTLMLICINTRTPFPPCPAYYSTSPLIFVSPNFFAMLFAKALRPARRPAVHPPHQRRGGSVGIQDTGILVFAHLAGTVHHYQPLLYEYQYEYESVYEPAVTVLLCVGTRRTHASRR